MKKIPTIFERDWNGDRSRVVDQPHADCAWVFAGEGVATRKLDGTSCLMRDGKLFKRRELKAGAHTPPEFISEGTDAETGKTVGWLPIGDGPEDAAHRQALVRELRLPDGTYELIGPKVQGNPEGASQHLLIRHSLAHTLDDAPRTFAGLRVWLAGRNIEGIVFHHPDGRMAKIKLRDFGFKRASHVVPG